MSLDVGLRAKVRRLVDGYLSGQPVPADLAAEPAVIRCGTAVLYLRLVDAAPPVVRVFSPLLRRVERTPELLQELNDLNARLSFVRLFWRDGTVYAACELLAKTLTSADLTHACDSVADTADYYDERLQPRHGGETAFAEPA